MSKYLDLTGLTHFANKIKTAINAVSDTANSALIAANKAVTGITLGSSTTPLTKTDGVVNIPDKIKTATLTGTLESLSAGKYLSITIPHTVPAGYSFAGAILTGNGWTNGMISYVVYSSNSQIVVGNYAIAGDQANKTIALTAIYIKN